MDVHLDTDNSVLRLEFADPGAVEGFFTEARKQSGFFVTLAAHLPFLTRLRVRATAPGFSFGFAVEVVQANPMAGGFGTAFQLCDWGREQDAELERKLAGPADEPHEAELSPTFRIKKMNPTERYMLAMKASRVERQILLRDSSPQVLLGLLHHPQIEVKEVIEIVKSHFATSGTMEHVARNRKWMAHPELPGLIAKSNKTPQPLAVKLLDLVRTPDLRQMARNQGLREGLRKAALKAYMRRSGQR